MSILNCERLLNLFFTHCRDGESEAIAVSLPPYTLQIFFFVNWKLIGNLNVCPCSFIMPKNYVMYPVTGDCYMDKNAKKYSQIPNSFQNISESTASLHSEDYWKPILEKSAILSFMLGKNRKM